MPRYNEPAAFFVNIAADGTRRRYAVWYRTPGWEASLEWCRFHGIDPKLVPAGSVILRDARSCQIVYELILLDDAGCPRQGPDFTYLTETFVEQGEAPPLALPAEITTSENEISIPSAAIGGGE